MTTYKELAEHYETLAIAYQTSYDSWLEGAMISSQLKGVYVEMKSELIKYTKKTGKTAVGANNRLQVIHKAIQEYDFLLNDKERQNEHIRRLENSIQKIWNEKDELEKQLEATNKMLAEDE
jgi:hypothetical protein